MLPPRSDGALPPAAWSPPKGSEGPRRSTVAIVVALVLVVLIVIAYSQSDGGSSDATSVRSACQAGDLEACDRLYAESPSGSSEEEFGSTCGDRYPEQFGYCAERYGDSSSSSLTSDFVDCREGDMRSCDRLYQDSPVDSPEEEFGSTCGDRYSEQNGECYQNFG